MSSSFDYDLYHNYVHDILSEMNNLDNPDILISIYNKTIPVLNLLDVALLSNEYEEKARSAGLDVEEFGLPPKMELGIPDKSVVVDIKPKVSDMVTIRIYAHPFIDRPAWDEERKELIRGFMGLYFNLVARIRVLRMFESRIFQDQRMPFVGNLAALMRNLTRLRAMNKLVGHTIYRMNIYKFSRFNRILGRPIGDKIIEEYIRKLLAFSGEFGGVYRLGGDNFLGVIPNEMTPAVQKFFEGYTYITPDGNSEMIIQSRAGFYQILDNFETNDTIMGRANSTFAKATPKSKIRFFDFNEEKIEEELSRIESDFMQAMKDGAVAPYYQPKVDPFSDKIVGVEALCRWNRDGEIVTPFRFIPVLERNNQICTLDFYMLRKVCEDISKWHSRGYDSVRVSINFSRNNLADKNFVQKVIDVIDEYNVPRNKITVELTETTLETDLYEIKRVTEAFRKNDILISVDDFGMGYSSLNLIKDINWDVVKIDKAFVPATNRSNYDKSLHMLYNLIHMVNDIGMLSVVEGVETEEQKEIVKDFGCKVIQGYYYDKPMPKEELEAKLLGTYEGECRWHA